MQSGKHKAAFRARNVTATFEKWALGLKTGVVNDNLLSEIGSGFGEPGGTTHSKKIPGSIPPSGGNDKTGRKNLITKRKILTKNRHDPTGSCLNSEI